MSVRITRSNFISVGKFKSILFIVLHHGYINYSTWCHNSVVRDLDLLSSVQNIRLVHYIDEIMLLGQIEEGVATTVIIGNIYAREVDQIKSNQNSKAFLPKYNS